MRSHARPLRVVVALCLCSLFLAAAGCVSDHRPDAVPEDLVNQAVVPGIDAGSRFWGNTQTTGSKGWIAQFLAATPQTQTYFADKPKAYLAVSGGGPDGAFGAQFLELPRQRLGNRTRFEYRTVINQSKGVDARQASVSQT